MGKMTRHKNSGSCYKLFCVSALMIIFNSTCALAAPLEKYVIPQVDQPKSSTRPQNRESTNTAQPNLTQQFSNRVQGLSREERQRLLQNLLQQAQAQTPGSPQQQYYLSLIEIVNRSLRGN
jgi:hypothetical protein